MKKVIPVVIAIALICVVAVVNFGGQVKEKYSYGEDLADLNAYFDINDDSEIAIILQDNRIDEKAKLINDVVYIDREACRALLTERFYVDFNENLLLYTNATTTIRAEIGGTTYVENGIETDAGYALCKISEDTVYIALDYIKKFVNFTYEFFENPYRIQMYTEWGERTVANITEDTNVRWRGGVKSEILTSVQKGDIVEVLEVMDDWTKIKTMDAYIGYVENRLLSDERTDTEKAATNVAAEEYVTLNENKKINMVWHNIESAQDGYSLFKTCAYIKEVNVISPTWFWLNDNEGNFSSIADESYVTASHRMGMEVWALVSNFHTGTDVDLTEVLSYTTKREYLINGLIQECITYGVDGINVDFEQVPSSCGDHYIQFIRELSLAAHEYGLIVSVDNFVPSEYTAHYNRKEQGLFVDYLIIMGYDEHYAGSEVGSVSSVSWMKKGIEDTIAVVDPSKVINAIPFYTRVWMTENGTTTSEALDMVTAKACLKKHGITTSWDEETCQNYGEATDGGIFYQVWMEDADSVKVRLNVMDTLGIAGVAAWRLGMETRDIWDILESYMLY